ncbi:MAG: TonB family protein [Desulfobacteraceae bacterium]|nr:TonB family protein [Desulfobacteraceae bacterium]
MSFLTWVYSAGSDRHPVLWPFIVSLLGHLLLFGIIILKPSFHSSDGSMFPSAITVQMVEMPAGSAGQQKKAETAEEKAPVLEKLSPITESSNAPSVEKPEVSIAPKQPKPKTALKYQTFKSKEVLKEALERIEKKVETAPPQPLQDTIRRLRDQVEKEGRPDGKGEGRVVEEGSAQGSKDGFAVGSRQEGELIDIYRTEVAFMINKNWAFSEQLAGGEGLMVSIVFKVMPDGRIEDIFFTDRSGNPYLDDSAYKAIVKSSPVKPHPENLNRPYVEMGLRFTPKGVQ